VIGIFGRSGISPAVVQKVAAEALAAVKEPDLIRQLTVVGVEPAGTGPADFAAVLQGESKRVAETLRAAGIMAK
jgi:tripartite-type tricarboxylate transporter receptor subunit TctC